MNGLGVFVLVLAAFALAAARCGDGQSPNVSRTPVPLDAGVTGMITIGPMCPVVQEDTPCPDQPYQADITILDEDGDEVITFQSSEGGKFWVNLSAGRYTLVPQSPNDGGPPSAPEQEFEVRRGEVTELTVQYDSGIR